MLFMPPESPIIIFLPEKSMFKILRFD